MGANEFTTYGSGETAEEAFSVAVSNARYDYGHAGYTGTIAEKSEFVIIGKAPDHKAAIETARRLLAADDPRITDKWGPAGCVSIAGTPDFLFFGWASS